MRKLATVRIISDIRPIPKADYIELAIVDGWQCVIKKGSFTINEPVIYCEIDSVLPVHPDYEYLHKSSYVKKDWLVGVLPDGEGYRLRTMKLKGQVSQGLLLPTYLLGDSTPPMGADVSHILGIIKWDPPVPANLSGSVRGNFPSYIPKTDQERVQNIVQEVFHDNTNSRWEVTLKLDGSSCTFYHKDGDLGVCSRNINLKLEQTGNTFVDMFHKLGIAHKVPQYGNIAIQGEMMGPGIQGNREGLHYPAFYAYDVWDIDGQYYLPKGERDAIIEALGMQSVPVIHPGATLQELGCDTLDAMLQYADRPSMNHEVAEGVVFKAVLGSHTEDILYSFKCINNRYLLGEK